MHGVQRHSAVVTAALVITILTLSHAGFAQVSPAEITNPGLKRVEQTHFQQLIDLSHAISHIRFPFPFELSRYAGLDPKQQLGADTRGLEFVNFQGRVILKVSGNYNAAFNARLLTQNQRANRTLDDVIVPILRIVPAYFGAQSDFDGAGFEISYHVRTEARSYSYEGKEVLTVVFSKADALNYASAKDQSERQEILSNSEVYVDGDDFGLLLGQRDPVPVEKGEKEARPRPAPSSQPPTTPTPSGSEVRLPGVDQGLPLGLRLTKPQTPEPSPPPEIQGPPTTAAPTAATQADADALQAKLQTQLQALDEEGRMHDHFVDYAPPSFVIFRKRIYLQMTLRNPNVFDKDATSIYRRTAQSFDLFLAPRLKTLLGKVPTDPTIAGLDITVLTEFSAKATTSSEALEFICPIGPLRQFTDADITNQDLINQSVILVNGVRIALNLQQVE